MSEQKQTTPDSLELAKDAINYTLQRIQKDPNIRFHMGAFTETFKRLKAAHCALNGISPEALEAEIFGHKLTRKPYALLVEEIREILAHAESGGMEVEALEQITAIVRH